MPAPGSHMIQAVTYVSFMPIVRDSIQAAQPVHQVREVAKREQEVNVETHNKYFKSKFGYLGTSSVEPGSTTPDTPQLPQRSTIIVWGNNQDTVDVIDLQGKTCDSVNALLFVYYFTIF